MKIYECLQLWTLVDKLIDRKFVREINPGIVFLYENISIIVGEVLPIQTHIDKAFASG
jgi:hypothetical protein